MLGPSYFHYTQHHSAKLLETTLASNTTSDDTQLYVHLSSDDAPTVLNKLSTCLSDVQTWMSSSKLKLNPDKTEFIVFGSHEQHHKLNSLFPVNILDNLLLPAQKVKNLGVWFDADLSLSDHVSSICKSCFLQLRELRRIRQYLSLDSARLVANALVTSRLDYYNSDSTQLKLTQTPVCPKHYGTHSYQPT